jgi:hypothetical protein
VFADKDRDQDLDFYQMPETAMQWIDFGERTRQAKGPEMKTFESDLTRQAQYLPRVTSVALLSRLPSMGHQF